MALGRYKTFTDGSVLTAAELNGVQDHITGNAATLISPFTQNLNANSNQITNLVIETVSATPSATPEGRMVYHTTLDQLQVMDGANVRRVPAIASVTAGDMIVSTVADQWARLAVGANGLTLVAAGGVPTWGNVTLSNVTGTLATANGGTGATTAAEARTNLGLGDLATQSGPVLTPDGTIGAPAYSFWSDQDSGMRLYADGNVTLVTGGADRVFINATSVYSTVPLDLGEIATPSAPPVNRVFIYCVDNGAGKTQLQARFPTGAVQVLATQP